MSDDTPEKPRRKPRRRGSGEGSIFQRKDGRWASTITVGYDQNGKRRRKTVYGATKREVTEQLTRLQTQKLDGQLFHRERLTVSDLIDRWLSHWSPNLAESTKLRYAQVSRTYIKPHLGGMTVEKIQPIHVRALLDQLSDQKVGDRTRQHVFATLRRAMNLACRLDLAAANPCSRVEPPQSKSKAVSPPTPEQVAKLLEVAQGTPFEALFVLAVTTGARQGELFALAWEDFDLSRSVLTIQRSLQEVRGVMSSIKEPKSAAGKRTVRLPEMAVEALKSHRQTTGKVGGYLFTDREGGFLRKSNFQRRVWKPLFKSADLEGMRFHDLRHAHASLLLRAKIHPKIVQERLGHSSIKLTMDTYSHLMPDAQDEAANATDLAFRKPTSSGGCQLAVNSSEIVSLPIPGNLQTDAG